MAGDTNSSWRRLLFRSDLGYRQYKKRYPEKIKLVLHEETHRGDLGKTNYIRTLSACEGEHIACIDGDDYWRGGLAFDIPVGFSSRLIMGDLYTEIPVDSGPTRVWAELGSRIQVSNLTVIDVGLATRLDEWDDGGANVALIVGFSRVFGIGSLVGVPEYPNPRIR